MSAGSSLVARSPAPLRPSREPLAARPLARLEDALEAIAPREDYWGFLATPAEARLERRPGAEWRELLARPRRLEARIFADRLDLRWLDDRGLALVPAAEADADGLEVVGGEGWQERERRSRLWGEWLEGSELWVEERIPRPIAYRGLAPGPASRDPFLRYVEYVRGGVVRQVRYLTVEGDSR